MKDFNDLSDAIVTAVSIRRYYTFEKGEHIFRAEAPVTTIKELTAAVQAKIDERTKRNEK